MSEYDYTSRCKHCSCGHWTCHFVNSSRGMGILLPVRDYDDSDLNIPPHNHDGVSRLAESYSLDSACILDYQIVDRVYIIDPQKCRWVKNNHYAIFTFRSLAVDRYGQPITNNGRLLATTFDVANSDLTSALYDPHTNDSFRSPINKYLRVRDFPGYGRETIIKTIAEHIDMFDEFASEAHESVDYEREQLFYR